MLPIPLAAVHLNWVQKSWRHSPGAHVAVFTDSSDVGVVGRLIGLELRDTLLVIRAGPSAQFIFLFRIPNAFSTTQTVVEGGVGGLNIADCKVGTTGGTKRGSQVPYPKKSNGREDRSDCWARTGHDIVSLDEGRWPSNVVLVHGESCATVCESTCPVRILDRQGSEALAETLGLKDVALKSSFYMHFRTLPELLGWVSRLIHPPRRMPV